MHDANIRVAIAGAGGRMGRQLIQAAHSDTERYHGLAGRLGVWGGADLPSRLAERARPYCQPGR